MSKITTRASKKREMNQREVQRSRGIAILLSEVDAKHHDYVLGVLTEYYPLVLERAIFEDPWPITYSPTGAYMKSAFRWKPDSMIRDLSIGTGMEPPTLDLTNIVVQVASGTYSRLDYRRMMKRIGYSLSGYFELNIVAADDDDKSIGGIIMDADSE